MQITQLSKILWSPYEDINKEILLEMLTSGQSQGFSVYKLEKDFYLTILLILISRNFPELVFKWWTCLNKIYFDYYRLSEDLDFVLILEWGRKSRKTTLEQYKQNLSQLFAPLWFVLVDQRTKYNEDTQGIFEFKYTSLIDGSKDKIKVDIRIETALKKLPINKEIIAIYQDPISDKVFFQNHTIQVMDLDEIFAEKMRASLTRIEPAIRDFFDIHYAKQKAFDFMNIQDLIQEKVAEVNFVYTIDQDGVFEELQRQVKTELDPVLKDNYDFDLSEIYQFILSHKK